MEFWIDIYTASKIRVLVKVIGEEAEAVKVKHIIESRFKKIKLQSLPGGGNEKYEDKSIHIDFMKFQNQESIWRDYQRWRETLGIIAIAHLPSGVESTMSKAMETLGILASYQKICDANKLVLNSSLLITTDAPESEISGSFPENTHFCFPKGGEMDDPDFQADLEKFIFSYFKVIVDKIDVEASNFADSKNEGLIITLADINVDENFTTMSNRRVCRKSKSAADMLLLRGDYEQANALYDTAIHEGSIASDSLWIAGALLGKASVHALMNKEANMQGEVYDDYVHELIKECHQRISETKITELEVEISLTYSRYLKQFEEKKQKLVELISYMTRHDLKRLRKREKGHYYYHIANICKDVGFKRKYSCFMVLACQHLDLIKFYTHALTAGYGVNFDNFDFDPIQEYQNLTNLSIAVATKSPHPRFRYKEKAKIGPYKELKKKIIPRNSYVSIIRPEPSKFEQVDKNFHWTHLQKFLLKELFDSYINSEDENWEIVDCPKDVMALFSEEAQTNIRGIKYRIALALLYQNGYWLEVANVFKEEEKLENELNLTYTHFGKADVDVEFEEDILMTESLAKQTFSTDLAPNFMKNFRNKMIKRKLNPRDLRPCWVICSKCVSKSAAPKSPPSCLSTHKVYICTISLYIPLSIETPYTILKILTSGELAEYKIMDSSLTAYNDLHTVLKIKAEFVPFKEGIFKIVGCIIKIPHTKVTHLFTPKVIIITQ